MTLLYPFAPPTRLSDLMRDDLRRLFGAVPDFSFTLAATRRFGDEVLYLAPEPDGPFRHLTAAIHQRFVEYPPYEGAYDDVVPHLTLAQGAPPDQMDQVQFEIERHLPIAANATEAWLMVGSQQPASWRVAERFALGSKDRYQ